MVIIENNVFAAAGWAGGSGGKQKKHFPAKLY